jgi:hypothetical protein
MEGRGVEYKVGGGSEGCLSRCINQYPLRTAKVRVGVGGCVGEREGESESERETCGTRLFVSVCVW